MRLRRMLYASMILGVLGFFLGYGSALRVEYDPLPWWQGLCVGAAPVLLASGFAIGWWGLTQALKQLGD